MMTTELNKQAIIDFIGSEKIVLASNNQGKVEEFSRLLAPLGFNVVPQGDLQIPAADEPFLTFVENALAKARHASLASGLPALADDSGICVSALNDAPGIFSARYAGEQASDQANNQQLIRNLQGVANRNARYVCALVLIKHPKDPEPMIVTAQWHGEVIDDARGHGGFGYDCHFYLPAFEKTVAEISMELKNILSHRALATEQLIQALMDQSVR
ncbi:RdgB/HAM1 family non-canonical purine NTP pyrophosphatase [Polynucleobacter kasalickyi]|uniref:dITP/XTP pyrophosphatase n=1 Tax=Polynucleobacter kasalickyi TaxID=1938817 RepID=A0A1W1Y4F2_9BURK|nr:RdgB/HAM1 family non-canonical purine NTP pyrophosphatase [Polynucleobacter kasalickyi]SMC31035.1 XTP/dITP diphosphohydrolase [Polynucleobacter kasalickyi]